MKPHPYDDEIVVHLPGLTTASLGYPAFVGAFLRLREVLRLHAVEGHHVTKVIDRDSMKVTGYLVFVPNERAASAVREVHDRALRGLPMTGASIDAHA